MDDHGYTDFSEVEARAVIYRCTLGLAVVVSLVVPTSIRNHDRDISMWQFRQSLVSEQQSAEAHRRDVFEARRLAYEEKSNTSSDITLAARSSPR